MFFTSEKGIQFTLKRSWHKSFYYDDVIWNRSTKRCKISTLFSEDLLPASIKALKNLQPLILFYEHMKFRCSYWLTIHKKRISLENKIQKLLQSPCHSLAILNQLTILLTPVILLWICADFEVIPTTI